jgi:hypothetical protein
MGTAAIEMLDQLVSSESCQFEKSRTGSVWMKVSLTVFPDSVFGSYWDISCYIERPMILLLVAGNASRHCPAHSVMAKQWGMPIAGKSLTALS